MITEEQLNILKENEIFKKLFSEFDKINIEVAQIKRDISKINNFLNDNLSKSIDKIILNRLEEIKKDFRP